MYDTVICDGAFFQKIYLLKKSLVPTSQDLQYYLKVASRIYFRTSTNTNFRFVFLCQHLNFGIQIPWKAIEMITFQCYKEALSTFIMTAHKSWEEKFKFWQETD